MIDRKVFFGVLIISIFTYFYIYNDVFYAFIISSLLLVKGKLLTLFNTTYLFISTFIFSSKAKLISYLKTLTIYKTFALAIKRFIIDNVFSKWLNETIIFPILKPTKEYIKYYLSLDIRSKFKKLMYFLVPISVFTYGIQAAGLIEHIMFFAEIKTIVIGFFKIVWLVSGKAILYVTTFLQTSWLAPIFEIFALSWLISKLEKIPYIGKYISNFFQYLSNIFSYIFKIWDSFYHKFIYTNLSKKLKEKMDIFSEKMSGKLEITKHNNEVYLIRKFKEEFLDNGKIKEIVDRFGFYEADIITSKSIKINAYLELENGFAMLIESYASCNNNGNSNGSNGKIKQSHFWILNYSPNEIEIYSKNNYFKKKRIKPYKLILFSSLIQNINDIILEQNGIYSNLTENLSYKKLLSKNKDKLK